MSEEIAEAMTQPAEAPVPEAAPEFNDEQAMGDIWDKAQEPEGRERGPDGRFLSRSQEPDSPAEVASPGEGEGAESVTDPAVAPSAPQTPAPAHIPNALKSHWDKLPEEARQAFVTHQSEMDRKFGDVGNQMRDAKPILDGLNSLKQEHPQLFQGKTAVQMADSARQLGMVQARLETGDHNTKMDTAYKILEVYGLLPHMAAALNGKTFEQAPQDQTISQLRNEISSLQQKLGEVGSPDYIEQHVSKLLEARDAQTKVEQFSQGKDFYADVEADLPHFINKAWSKLGASASQKTVFDAAYDMAVHADPELRAKVIAANAQKAAAQPDPKRTEQARKAATSNVKSTSSGNGRIRTFEEDLGATWDRLNS